MERKNQRRAFLAGAAILLIFVLHPATPAFADSQTVTDCSNENQLTNFINGAPASGRTITFSCGPADVTITFSSHKVIQQDITIDGGGLVTLSGQAAAASGNYHFRVFLGATLTLQNIGLAHGNSNTAGSIENFGTTILTNVDISLNSNSSDGGAIVNHNTLVVTDSLIGFNHSDTKGGGISNLGTLTLNDSEVLVNSASQSGGGIYNMGTINMNRSTLYDNSAVLAGGGIYNFSPTSKATLNSSSVYVNRSTTSEGGGIKNDGTLTLQNSTISNNNAVFSSGGGIYNVGTVNAYFSTIAGNLADDNATGPGPGGGIYNDGGTVTLKGVLLAQNYSGVNASDCGASTTITSQDYNLIQTTSGCSISGATANNITGLDPQVDSLQDNGGPTETRALFFYSPAKDAVPIAQCTDQFGAPLTVDQRGLPRPIGAQCDIGAYEGSLSNNLFGVNLIRNGDAEGSAYSPAAAGVRASNWSSCCAAIVAYGTSGGFPSSNSPGPDNPGTSFFAGGNSSATSISQIRNVQDISATIDPGKVRFDLSGYFGGYDVQDDYAALAVEFDSGTGSSLGIASIGSVKAADRGNTTGLLLRTTSGLVPAGTRSIVITLTMVRVSGVGLYNDGYADNLSLVLTPTALYLPLIVR